MKLMLQALLADRFQLSFHRDNKDMKVFALIVARSGPSFMQRRVTAISPMTIRR